MFEPVVRFALPALLLLGAPPFVLRLGEWWAPCHRILAFGALVNESRSELEGPL